MNIKKEDLQSSAAGATTAAASVGAHLALKSPKNNSIAIRYNYSPGGGAGHKALANKYKSYLDSKGIKNVDLINIDEAKKSTNPLRYGAVIDTSAKYNPLVPGRVGAVRDNFWDKKNKAPYHFKTYSESLDYTPKAKGMRKSVSIAAGESGAALDEKLDAVIKSIGSRTDTDINVYAGRAAETIRKKYPTLKVHGMLSHEDYHKALASSDLHIGYTGASSINEQVAAKNPSVILTAVDPKTGPKKPTSRVAYMNANWAKSNYGVPVVSTKETENTSKVLNDILDNSEKHVN